MEDYLSRILEFVLELESFSGNNDEVLLVFINYIMRKLCRDIFDEVVDCIVCVVS